MNSASSKLPKVESTETAPLRVTTRLLELALRNLDHLDEGLVAARLSSVLDLLDVER